MSKFDMFTKAFAFANFYQAFKSFFGEEMVPYPACGNKSCHGSNVCPSSCHCKGGNGGPCVPS